VTGDVSAVGFGFNSGSNRSFSPLRLASKQNGIPDGIGCCLLSLSTLGVAGREADWLLILVGVFVGVTRVGDVGEEIAVSCEGVLLGESIWPDTGGVRETMVVL
jgi:hypothetical protein